MLPRSRRGRGPGQSRLGQQEEVLSLLGQRERRAEQLLQVATGRPARMHSDSLPASQKHVFFRKLFFFAALKKVFSCTHCVSVWGQDVQKEVKLSKDRERRERGEA